MSTPADNRCAWFAGGKRCRYVGAMSSVIATDKSYPELFCTGHFQCLDGDLGSKILEDSHREVPDGLDYSTAAIVAKVRQQRFEQAPKGRPMTPAQRAEIERKWPQIKLLEPSEEDSERAALQDDWPPG